MKCPLCQNDLINDNGSYFTCRTNVCIDQLGTLTSHFEYYVDTKRFYTHAPPFFIRFSQDKSEVYLHNSEYVLFNPILTADPVIQEDLPHFIERLQRLKAFL